MKRHATLLHVPSSVKRIQKNITGSRRIEIVGQKILFLPTVFHIAIDKRRIYCCKDLREPDFIGEELRFQKSLIFPNPLN